MMVLEREYQLKMQLEQLISQTSTTNETMKEDRKDNRTKIQATQQSELIDQRQTGRPPNNFEQEDQDNLGGFNLGL